MDESEHYLERPGTSSASPGRPARSGQEAFAEFVAEQAATADSRTSEQTPLREQDRFLPIANVARIMKSMVPKNGKISKEAKECCQECVSEFISFITSEASEKCAMEKRKTINAEDIINAMATLGFDQYIEPLKLFLSRYRELAKSERLVYGQASSNGGATASGGDLDAEMDDGSLGNILDSNLPGQPASPQPTFSGHQHNLRRHPPSSYR